MLNNIIALIEDAIIGCDEMINENLVINDDIMSAYWMGKKKAYEHILTILNEA